MKLQQSIPLSSIYKREEDFSAELADTLNALEVGEFEDVETESSVGTRQADIVAMGEDGTLLVVENQFGKADWDHWGRLEAYARLKEATAAALVAESFEDLMITTCILRNADSEIDWYLIQVQASSHEELSFHHIVRPAIDIQVEKKAESEYSEFWAPIRREGLFAGKPVPVRDESWVEKRVKGVILVLQFLTQSSTIRLQFDGEKRLERRDKVMELFPKSEYDYKYEESSNYASVVFPVLNKGKQDRDDWPEIREKLVNMGTSLYDKINKSDM